MPVTTIEEVIRTRLLAQAAVAAITETIRVDQFDQIDRPEVTPVILISVAEETFESQDIGGQCYHVFATVIVSAVAGKRSTARILAEAIRTNSTVPGTGLQGARIRTGAQYFDALLVRRDGGYVANDDGSDSGLYSVDSEFLVMYPETI